MNSQSQSQSVIKFCISNKIPFITFNMIFMNRNGERIKKLSGMPKNPTKSKDLNWMNWNFERCMKYNEDNKSNVNCLNINLTNSKYMIIDIDAWNEKENKPDNELVNKYIADYGLNWNSKSTRKKLPHLWRLKDENDKNTTKTNYKQGLDLIYTNVFEYIDSKIENTDDNIKIFDSYPEIENNKLEIKNKLKKVSSKSVDSGIVINTEIKESKENKDLKPYLNLIDNTGERVIDYNTWLKIIYGLKNDNINNYNMALEWSIKSPRHTLEHFNYVWNYEGGSRNSKGTVLYFAKQYNESGYLKLRLKSNLDNTDDNLCKIFITLQQSNLIYSNKEIYIYDDNWTIDDDKSNKLKRLIRITLKRYILELIIENSKLLMNSDIDEDSNENPYKSVKERLDKMLKKSSTKSSIDSISSFVIQELIHLDLNVEFDLGLEQIYNLHFKNGVYELNTKTFRKRTKDDYITQFLDWNYNDNVDDLLYKEVDDFYSKLQPEEEQKKFSLEWLAYNLSGTTGKQEFKMNIGYSASNGKSTEFKIHDKCFNIYSAKLDNKTFSESYVNKRHKQLRVLIKSPIRFAYIEELVSDKLDGDFLKDFVDGSNINCEIMYGYSENRKIQAKISTCGNSDFNFEMIDKGILRRGLIQHYNSRFLIGVEDNYDTNVYKRIDEYEQRFNKPEYKNAYLKLLLNYYDKDFKAPDANKKEFQSIADDYDEYQQILNTYFTVGIDETNYIIHKDDIHSIFKEKLNKPNLSWRELLKNLKSKGIKYKKDKMYDHKKGFFVGINLLDDADDIAEEVEN